MQNTDTAACNGCGMLFGMDPFSRRLTSDQGNILILQKIIKGTDMIFWKSRTIIGYGCGPTAEPRT